MKKERFNTGWKYIEGVINPFAAVFGDIMDARKGLRINGESVKMRGCRKHR